MVYVYLLPLKASSRSGRVEPLMPSPPLMFGAGLARYWIDRVECSGRFIFQTFTGSWDNIFAGSRLGLIDEKSACRCL